MPFAVLCESLGGESGRAHLRAQGGAGLGFGAFPSPHRRLSPLQNILEVYELDSYRVFQHGAWR